MWLGNSFGTVRKIQEVSKLNFDPFWVNMSCEQNPSIIGLRNNMVFNVTIYVLLLYHLTIFLKGALSQFVDQTEKLSDILSLQTWQ